jgi:alpha-amylase
VKVKEEGLDLLLHYDTYRRNCMIEHFLGPGTTLENFRDVAYNEEGDFVNAPYSAEMEATGKVLNVILARDGHVTTETGARPVRVSKRLTLKPGSPHFRVRYTIQNTGDEELTAVFASEWNINLLGGGHNPTAYYRVEGVELDNPLLDSTGEVKNVRELAVGNSWLEIELGLRLNHEATFWRYPIETVSGSEAGFERVYQGSCLLLQWLLKLPAGDSVDIELQWRNQGSTGEHHDDWLS